MRIGEALGLRHNDIAACGSAKSLSASGGTAGVRHRA